MRNSSGEKTLVRRRNCLAPGVAFWQNRGHFFLSRERLNPRHTKSVAAREGELTRLTGLKPIKKGDRMKKSLIAVAVAGLFSPPPPKGGGTPGGALNPGDTHPPTPAGATTNTPNNTTPAHHHTPH